MIDNKKVWANVLTEKRVNKKGANDNIFNVTSSPKNRDENVGDGVNFKDNKDKQETYSEYG